MGSQVNFFKFFWSDIGHFLIRSLNYAFKHGHLSITQSRGIVSILPKGDKPRGIFEKLETNNSTKCHL